MEDRLVNWNRAECHEKAPQQFPFRDDPVSEHLEKQGLISFQYTSPISSTYIQPISHFSS